MKRIILTITFLFYCLSAFALPEGEGASFVKTYYRYLTEYAAAENVMLAKKIEGLHVGSGFVYPDVEINLGRGMTEVDGVGIKSVYLASIMSRQNLLLKFVPNNLTLVSNSNGICTIEYTLFVYSGNEQPGRDVLKYTVPLKMEIRNSDKKIMSILKNTRSTLTQYTLNVNPSLLTFDASGGTRSITVNSNTNWEISVNTASWGHITTNGNMLTLRVDPYNGSTDRTDYFKIKAGDKEEKINIKQSASSNSLKSSAQIKSISVSKDQYLDGGSKGIIIHVAFDVQNMKDKEVRASAYFYDIDGNALNDTNNAYRTSDDKVSTGKTVKPSSDNSSFNDLQLTIPYSELHQSGTNSRTIKFSISIWDRSTSPSKKIGSSSSYTTFTYIPTPEIVFLVDNSALDKTKNFSESGGRETYYINTTASSYDTWGVPTWCRIENKTSSSFTLVCEPNPTTSQRSDYMKVKAGGKEIRIDIKQEGKKSEAIVENCWLTHNLSKQIWTGYMWTYVSYMRIHCHFSVAGHLNEKIRVCAYFYYPNGNKVTALNNEFRTSDGQATVQGTDKCTYSNTLWKDFTLDIPYYALPKGSLMVKVQIQDKNGAYLAESSKVSFQVF